MGTKQTPGPFIGIDFGTTNSCAAWYDPRLGRAAILKNAEGEEKTPSVIYFGDDQVLVGKSAEDKLQEPDERSRVVGSIKRELVSAPVFVFGKKRFTPVEMVAEILRKIKADAEEYHYHEPVTRAVITFPAQFDLLEKRKIEEAGKLAGLLETEMLEEPVAAAIAYAEEGMQVGNHVLVYDLGGGTFDLAVLSYASDGARFRLAMPPKGIRRCGGDDFDLALYNFCDDVAQDSLSRGITETGEIDHSFLRECRRRKENLSSQERTTFSSYLLSSGQGVLQFKHAVDRTTFEGLIGDLVGTTARLTKETVDEAHQQGAQIDTVVLIGGSSRVPLVDRSLREALEPLAPQKWQSQDIAVALGAAYHAHTLWGAQPANRTVGVPRPRRAKTPLPAALPAVPTPPAPPASVLPAPYAPAAPLAPRPAAPIVPQPYAMPVRRPVRDYLWKSVLSLVLVYLFYPVGLLLNIIFLNQANEARENGYDTRNAGCLKALIWYQVIGFITSLILVFMLFSTVLVACSR